jgi:hypothetical protein
VAQPDVLALGYLSGLAVLVVFGAWGFRSGSGRQDNRNGGGSARPDAAPPPPPAGGRELDGDFDAWAEQCGSAADEPAADEPAAARRA